MTSINDASAIFAAMLRALAPPPNTKPSEWAEQNLVLPRESNARPGKLRLTNLQKQIVDAAAEPGTRELILMTSAQIGKTTAIHAILGHAICGEGGPLLNVRPDENDVSSYCKETLDPLIAASPALRQAISHSNANLKTFAGGSLALASSYKAPQLSGKAIRFGIIDELDRCAAVTSNGEGRPEDLVRRRLHTFRRSLLLLASTPTFAATSRIASNYERGDKRLFFVKCEHCGDEAPITQDRLYFESGQPDGARLLCEGCGALADEAERLRMVATGEFRSTTQGEPGVVSIHANELCGEFSSLTKVAAQVDSAKSLEQKKTVVNLCWGLPFEASSEVENNASELQSRAEPIEAPYDSAFDFITCGVDIQASRIEAQFLASKADGATRAVLDHVILHGDTTGPAPWTDLDALMAREFRMRDGRNLALSVTFIDGGFQTEAVARFVMKQRAKGRRAHIVFGRDGFDRVAVKEGSKVKGLLRGLILGVDNIKLNVAKSLQSGATKLPSHLDADFFDQLAAERLAVRYVKGFPRTHWEKDKDARNEAFDALVYATAAASLVNGRASRAEGKAKPQTTDIAARLAALNSNYRKAA
jgi:phage terminase large subunit GpA-like protein